MNESKHISGPWVCEHFPDGSAIKKYNDHEPHEDCSGNLVVADISGNSDICRANAELIAAAPDLLESCWTLAQIIRDEFSTDGESWETIKRYQDEINEARAAIAKACGVGER